MRPFFRFVALAVPGLALSLAGCASVSPVPPIDTSSVQYRAAAMDEAGLDEHAIVVLPVMAGDSDSAVWAQVGDSWVTSQLQKRRPDLAIVPAKEAMQRIQDVNATDRYRTVLDTSSRPDRLDRAALADVATAARGRYVLISTLWVVTSSQPFPGGVTQARLCEIQSQLWDSETGEIVWEGVGGGAAPMNTPVMGGGTPGGRAVQQAATGLAMRLGKSTTEVPPANTVADMHAVSQQEIVQTEIQNEAAADAACLGAGILLLLLDIAD